MNLTSMTPPTEPDRHDTRSLVRQVASEMATNREMPNAEKVRKEIQLRTGGALNPSTLTVQDEMKKWMADTFWPNYHRFAALPEQTNVPAAMQALFAEGFQKLVVGAIDLARTAWDTERDALTAEKASVQGELRTLREDSERLRLQLDSANEENNTLRQQLQQANRQQAELREQLDRINAALQAATEAQAAHERELNEVRETERRQAQANVDAAREDTRRALREVDEMRQAAKVQEKNLTRVNEELATLRDRAVKAEARADTLAQTHAAEKQALVATHAAETERLRQQLPAPVAKPSEIKRQGFAARPTAMRRIRRTLK